MMVVVYFIAKIIAIIVCIVSSLLLLYLSIRARMFMVSLKELESLLTKDIRKFIAGGSVALSALLPFIFKTSNFKADKTASPFGLIAFIIDMVKTRSKS